MLFETALITHGSFLCKVHVHTCTHTQRKRTFDKEWNNKVTYSVIKHKSDKNITQMRVTHPQLSTTDHTGHTTWVKTLGWNSRNSCSAPRKEPTGWNKFPALPPKGDDDLESKPPVKAALGCYSLMQPTCWCPLDWKEFSHLLWHNQSSQDGPHPVCYTQ